MAIYVVIRKCCLGPNCSYGHGAPTYDKGSNKVIDRRVLVAQFCTSNRRRAETCAANWSEYDAELRELGTGDEFMNLHPQSQKWLQETIEKENLKTGKSHDDVFTPPRLLSQVALGEAINLLTDALSAMGATKLQGFNPINQRISEFFASFSPKQLDQLRKQAYEAKKP